MESTFSTFKVFPISSVALRAVIAASASSADSMVTNPNPRDSRVWGSYMTEAFWTYNRDENHVHSKMHTNYSANFSKSCFKVAGVDFMTKSRDVEVVSRVMTT